MPYSDPQKRRDYQRQYQSKWRKENSDKVSAIGQRWYIKNGDKKRASHRAWMKQNRLQQSKWQREAYATNLNYRMSQILRSRLFAAIKGRFSGGSAVCDLGCSVEELKTHLEFQFQPGMTWENWAHDGWHIDHKIPLAKFDLTDREQLLRAVHYTNLQPLWAKDNLSKGAR